MKPVRKVVSDSGIVIYGRYVKMLTGTEGTFKGPKLQRIFSESLVPYNKFQMHYQHGATFRFVWLHTKNIS